MHRVTQANPEGIVFGLDRERRANMQALYVVDICVALQAVGAFFDREPVSQSVVDVRLFPTTHAHARQTFVHRDV